MTSDRPAFLAKWFEQEAKSHEDNFGPGEYSDLLREGAQLLASIGTDGHQTAGALRELAGQLQAQGTSASPTLLHQARMVMRHGADTIDLLAGGASR